MLASSSIGNDRGHQGLVLDAESGLYYNRTRYYHPTLGVFIQRDPLGYVDGMSVYQYERTSPAVALDPSGTWAGGAVVVIGGRVVWVSTGAAGTGVVAGSGIVIYQSYQWYQTVNQIDAVTTSVKNDLKKPLPQPKFWKAPKTCPNGTPPDDCQIHHIGTDAAKNDFNDILGQGGLNTESWQNKCQVCDMGDGQKHEGPHDKYTPSYNDVIKSMMKTVVDGVKTQYGNASGEQLKLLIKNALGELLGNICADMNTPGTALRDMVTH